MTKKQAKTANEIFKDLFNGVTADDVLMWNGKSFNVGDKVLPLKDNMDIVSGATTLKNMYVWKLLVNDMKWQANKRIFLDSRTTDDILAGKMVLWTIDIMEKKLESLSKIKWTK